MPSLDKPLSSFLHDMPDDLKEVLDQNLDVQEKWNTLTPLKTSGYVG
jgi:uncharacterized protein YdeI (YjbR/CyaY-like superfamily)